LKEHEIKISMDGKGRWMDNVMIERLWRSVKYEHLYLQEFENIQKLKHTLKNWFDFYNQQCPHAPFSGHGLNEVYYETVAKLAA
tara:strand:- start:147 stop:398 length:252 start_codon:yes stop_codon:yes gene_type:complete